MATSVPTCAVRVALRRVNGAPVVAAVVTAQISQTEMYADTLVDTSTSATTDSSGDCVLTLFPNALGAPESVYDVTVAPADGSRGRVVQIRVADTESSPLSDLTYRDGQYQAPILILENGEPLVLEDGNFLEV